MSRPHQWAVLAAGVLIVTVGVFGIWRLGTVPSGVGGGKPSPGDRGKTPVQSDAPQIAQGDQAEKFCGACHAYPPPDSFPKASWPDEVSRGFDFYRKSDLHLEVPDEASIVAYYQAKAPERLPVLPRTASDTHWPVELHRREIPGPRPGQLPAIAFVGLGRLTDPTKPDLIACDMAHGDLLTRRAAVQSGSMGLLAEGLGNLAHAEVVDLDRDGVNDLLVADLGFPLPTDDRRGRVLWLRGTKGGSYETRELAADLGRVCDIQAADFDADGDLDLVVAVFGWRRVGEILYLEQRPGPDGRPEFLRKTLDPRHGTIHVPVVDLNHDGRPDFVALISQEHETVVAFLNKGGGEFSPRTLFKGPHPAFGSSGLQVLDLDGDGDLDALLTNGDVYDTRLLKPYHGVSWLENQGEGPFVYHQIGAMYGAHRALAGDLDGDGDLDVVATSFLGEPYYGALRREVGADAVVLFEQVSPGTFVRHAIERETCDYPSFALGDIDGDGDLDIVAGRFHDFSFAQADSPKPAGPAPAPLVVWENLGPSKTAAPPVPAAR
jgi:hypothetical protein